MNRILLAGLFILGWGVAQAQVAVVAPSLELQEAMNHAEQLQQIHFSSIAKQFSILRGCVYNYI